MLLLKLAQTLSSKHIPYAIVGGYAVALHGAVRGTMDVDLILKLNEKDYSNAEKALQEIGLRSRLPVNAKQVFQFRDEYIKNRNLIAWSFYNPNKPSEMVDIIITENLEEMHVKKIKYMNQTINVLSLDDLIGMKRRSGRPQDIEDISALEMRKKK